LVAQVATDIDALYFYQYVQSSIFPDYAIDQHVLRRLQVLIIALMYRNFFKKKSSTERMHFPNEQSNCFADLRILKTKHFHINYNKLVIQKLIGSQELGLCGRISGGSSTCLIKYPQVGRS
jgi:hypothetical protein